jgi:hypothetical protein
MDNIELKKFFTAKMLLGNIGAIGGLYYAYKKKSNFGVLLLSSLIGSIVGTYIGSKLDESTDDSKSSDEVVTEREQISSGKPPQKLDLSVENENMESQMRNFL